MNSIFTAPKAQASALRVALLDLHGLDISHSQALNLMARMEGKNDWNTLSASLFNTWAYQCHEDYISTVPGQIRYMSLNTAVREEMAAFSNYSNVQEKLQFSLQRMFWQINMASQGGLNVEPELRAALTRSSQTLDALALEELEARENFGAFLTEYADKPMSEVNKQRYSTLYVTWRLATLSFQLAAFKNPHRPTANSFFLRLADSGHSLYTVAAMLADETNFDHLVRCSDKQLNECLREGAIVYRELAQDTKTAVLNYVRGMDAGVAQALPGHRYAARVFNCLDSFFPEIALWQAWIELKPLLADSADAQYKR